MSQPVNSINEQVKRFYLGIDWGGDAHEISLVNGKGEKIAQQRIEHTVAGFERILALCQKAQIEPKDCLVGIETAHNLLIDWLWSQGFEQIYVIPPGTVDKSRQRFHLSGAKDDHLDVDEITHLLRVERHRLLSWHPGSSRLQQMRAAVRFALFLSKRVVADANRLSAVLSRYYPAALATFSSWPTPLACQLILHYPDPAQAKTVSYAQFKAFALDHRYPNPKQLLACFDRFQATYPKASPEICEAYLPQAITLAQLLHRELLDKGNTLLRLKTLFVHHEDAPIFSSFPGLGDLLAPALLIKFGEDRTRFPSPSLLQALAGTAPVTIQSNKTKRILFRHACDLEFRYIAQEWALHSLKDSVWAASYFQELLKRNIHRQHAYRILANRWVAIAWRCWQSRKPYDEAAHLLARSQRRLPKVIA